VPAARPGSGRAPATGRERSVIRPSADALSAARRLADEHGLPVDRLVVLKDGSNLLVHVGRTPVVLRAATLTAHVRGDPVPCLARERDLVGWLASVGAPVMRPSAELPPGPHLVDGWAISAWTYVDHVAGAVPTTAETLGALDVLHDAMRGYPGELPLLGPMRDDLDAACAFAVDQGILPAGHVDDIRSRRDRLVEELLAADPDIVPQHGDAFPRNALLTPNGIVWIDFEDCCAGPRLWDLGTMLRQAPSDERVTAEIVRRYGREAVEVAIALRSLQLEVWSALHEARVERGWSMVALPQRGGPAR
jgi:hypothetical protein